METLNLIKNDPWLEPFEDAIKGRHQHVLDKEAELTNIYTNSLYIGKAVAENVFLPGQHGWYKTSKPRFSVRRSGHRKSHIK